MGVQEQQRQSKDVISASNPISAETTQKCFKKEGSLHKDASVKNNNFLMRRVAKSFKKKKNYRVLKEKVQNIMSFYGDKTDFNFFKALSSLCYFVSFLFIISYYSHSSFNYT